MAKDRMKVVFTFEDSGFEKAVKGLLATKGVDVSIHAVFSKESVERYIRENPDTDAVVLMEVFAKRGGYGKPEKYTAAEVAALTGASDVNVIIVLSENHKGTAYMRTLYSAGVTSAIFQKKTGVKPAEVAGLILQKRNRNNARIYYGIEGQKLDDVGIIDLSDFNRLYASYKNGGESLLENYLRVCQGLSMKQVADFTGRLPDDDKEYLAQFDEFHTVLGYLAKLGIDLKIKRPKKTNIGLNYVYSLEMRDAESGIDFTKTDVPRTSEPEGEGVTRPEKVGFFAKLFRKKKDIKGEVQQQAESAYAPDSRASAMDIPFEADTAAQTGCVDDSMPETLVLPASTGAVCDMDESGNGGGDSVADEIGDVAVGGSAGASEMSFADFLNSLGTAEMSGHGDGAGTLVDGAAAGTESVESVQDGEVTAPGAHAETVCVQEGNSLEGSAKPSPGVDNTVETVKPDNGLGESSGLPNEISSEEVTEHISIDYTAPMLREPGQAKEQEPEGDDGAVEFDSDEYEDYVLLGETRGRGKGVVIVLAVIVLAIAACSVIGFDKILSFLQ